MKPGYVLIETPTPDWWVGMVRVANELGLLPRSDIVACGTSLDGVLNDFEARTIAAVKAKHAAWRADPANGGAWRGPHLPFGQSSDAAPADPPADDDMDDADDDPDCTPIVVSTPD